VILCPEASINLGGENPSKKTESGTPFFIREINLDLPITFTKVRGHFNG
jgi:hypothetical protein